MSHTAPSFRRNAHVAFSAMTRGMMAFFNYRMIVPATLFFCLALASSLWLAAIGSKIPRVLTLIVFLAAPTTSFVA